MTRARAGLPFPLWDGGGAVELMIELLFTCMFPPLMRRWRSFVPRVVTGPSGRMHGRLLPFTE